MDKQGRISLKQELCELCDYEPGTKVFFTMVDNTTWELVCQGELGEEQWIESSSIIDSNYRVFVPVTIRKLYTDAAVVIGDVKKKKIRIKFFELKNDL